MTNHKVTHKRIAHNFIDITGQRFGHLIVLERDSSIKGKTHWICRCDCGTVKSVNGYRIKHQLTKSCGVTCPVRISGPFKHGKTKTSEYRIWQLMRRRCNDPKDKDFIHYGGRGIFISKEWDLSFNSFFADMGPRPSPKHEIDRRDNDGPYSSDNCRWVTRKVNMRNTRITNFITVNGQRISVADAADLRNLNTSTVAHRLRRGWSVDKALSPVVRHSKTT